MNDKIKQIINTLKNFALTTLGHAISGAGVGALFELEKLFAVGNPISMSVILTAVAIGGAIGFFKTIVEEIEKMKKSTAATVKATKAYFI